MSVTTFRLANGGRSGIQESTPEMTPDMPLEPNLPERPVPESAPEPPAEPMPEQSPEMAVAEPVPEAKPEATKNEALEAPGETIPPVSSGEGITLPTEAAPADVTPVEQTPETSAQSAEEVMADPLAAASAAEVTPTIPVSEAAGPVGSPSDTGEVSSCEWPAGSASAPEAPSKPPRPMPRWVKRFVAVVEPLSVAVVFIYLLAKTWMRWPDPFIDFPRDLYIAWRVSVGDALYNLDSYTGTGRQVASWYGPLAHLAEALGFRIFGVGMDTIVWMNVVLSVVVLLLLRGIFGVIGNRFSVWLCSMTFLLVFFVGHLVGIGNYNFITPYVAQTTYGLAGLLLLLWALLWHLRSDWGWWLWLAGVGLGVAFLNKPEPLLAAAGALGVYGALRSLQRFRQTTPGGGWRGAVKLLWTSAAWLMVGFAVTWVPVFIYFLRKGGAGYAVRATDWVIYTMVAGSYLKTVANSPLYAAMSGFDQPLQNFLIHLQAGVLLLLVCGLMVAGSRAWVRAEKFSFWWWLGPVVILGMGGLGAWLGEMAGNWMNVGIALNFSTFLITAILAAWCVWAAWRERADFERALGLTVVGTAAALMLVRMILYGRLFHYGFFMAPLAALFIIHWVVGEGLRPVEGQRRRNWLLPVVFAALVLYGGLSLTWFSLQRYAQKTFEVGTGRDRFYTFEPSPPNGEKMDPQRIYLPQGEILNMMVEEARKDLPNAKTLIAFPETAAVNYHLRVPCPAAEVEFQPTGLGFVGPEHVVDELKANPPDGVFFYMRNMLEFRVYSFGNNEGSGKAILDWVADHYAEMWNAGPHSQYLNGHALTPTGDAIDLFVPKPALTDNALPSPDQLMKSIGPK